MMDYIALVIIAALIYTSIGIYINHYRTINDTEKSVAWSFYTIYLWPFLIIIVLFVMISPNIIGR